MVKTLRKMFQLLLKRSCEGKILSYTNLDLYLFWRKRPPINQKIINTLLNSDSPELNKATNDVQNLLNDMVRSQPSKEDFTNLWNLFRDNVNVDLSASNYLYNEYPLSLVWLYMEKTVVRPLCFLLTSEGCNLFLNLLFLHFCEFGPHMEINESFCRYVITKFTKYGKRIKLFRFENDKSIGLIRSKNITI